MAELHDIRKFAYNLNRPGPATGVFRAAVENVVGAGNGTSTTAGTRADLADVATSTTPDGRPRIIGSADLGPGNEWMLRSANTTRRRQDATSTGDDGFGGNHLLALNDLVETLVSYQREIDALKDKASRLAEQYDQQAAQVLEARADAGEARKAASGMARLADWAFWAVILLGGGSAVLLIVLVLHALFPAAVAEWAPWIVGFVGLAGAIAVIAYLRELGKLNERVRKLEQHLPASGAGDFADR